MRSDRPKLVSWRQETRATRLSISMTPHRKQEVAFFFLKKEEKKVLSVLVLSSREIAVIAFMRGNVQNKLASVINLTLSFVSLT